MAAASPDARARRLLLLLWRGRLGQPTSVLLDGLESPKAHTKSTRRDLVDDNFATRVEELGSHRAAQRIALRSPLRLARNTRSARLTETELGSVRLAAICASASPATHRNADLTAPIRSKGLSARSAPSRKPHDPKLLGSANRRKEGHLKRCVAAAPQTHPHRHRDVARRVADPGDVADSAQ